MEISPGIHRIEMPLGDRIVCVFVLAGDDRCLLIDTGLESTPSEYIVPYLESAGINIRSLRYILNTHADFDHTGGNASLQQFAPDALFMCHELDRHLVEDIDRMIEERYGEFAADHGIDDSEETKDFIRANAQGVPIDLGLVGGERLYLGADWHVEILHTPGHSRGHLTVYDSRSHSAIIADTALWSTLHTKEGAPAFPPTYRYVDSYVGSIHWLQSLRIDTLLTSHYPVLHGQEADAFLSQSRAFVDRFDNALKEDLVNAERALTTSELIERLRPRLGEWTAESGVYLVFPLVGHLERLRHYGLVNSSHRGDLIAWEWAATARHATS